MTKLSKAWKTYMRCKTLRKAGFQYFFLTFLAIELTIRGGQMKNEWILTIETFITGLSVIQIHDMSFAYLHFTHIMIEVFNNYWMRLSKIPWFVRGEQINYLRLYLSFVSKSSIIQISLSPSMLILPQMRSNEGELFKSTDHLPLLAHNQKSGEDWRGAGETTF